MLKMIIAEDEFLVRDGMRNNIPWAEFGIEIIAEAADGQEALDLCRELRPDILFTDIRMPFMDGLEVALKLKEEGISIHIIIISGVQDFNYAKTALNINVEGYILKPVKLDELKMVINKVVSNIHLERNRESEIQQLKVQLNESLPIIREKFLRNLIAGYYTNESDVWDKIRYLSIKIETNETIMAAVLQIDDYHRTVLDKTEENKQLLSFSIISIIEKILNNYHSGIGFCTNENQFIILFNQKAQAGEKYLEICEEIISSLYKFLSISVSIGIGRPVSKILQLNFSFQDATTALQYKFYTGKNSILNISDISKNMKIEYPNLYETENQLVNFIKLGDSEGVSKLINEVFDNFSPDRKPAIGYIQRICVELISIASRSIYEFEENLENIFTNSPQILNTIYQTENIFDLRENMLSVFLEIADYFSKKHNQKNQKIIKKIKEIIDQKYMEDIGVAKLSEEVYLTPNYISSIFKQETGETIIEYLTKVRIEAAKELLKSTNFKILEISEMVGYENPQYFSTVFKKYTGFYPQKYRS